MKKLLLMIFIIIISVVILLFTVNNKNLVEINYILDSTLVPVSWVVCVSFILGIISTIPSFISINIKNLTKKKKIIQLIKDNNEKESIAEEFNKNINDKEK